jgi:hypothetical protein
LDFPSGRRLRKHIAERNTMATPKREEILRRHGEWKREEQAHSKAISKVIGIPILLLGLMVLGGITIYFWPK